MQYVLNYFFDWYEIFVPPKIKIIQFHGGFRLLKCLIVFEKLLCFASLISNSKIILFER